MKKAHLTGCYGKEIALTKELNFNEVMRAGTLEEDTILYSGLKLESDVTGCGCIKGGELNGGVNFTECHYVVKHICKQMMYSSQLLSLNSHIQQIFIGFKNITII